MNARSRACLPLSLVLCLLAGLPACSDPDQRPGIPPQHVLLITIDTLRADHLSSWLYPRPTSYLEATPEQRKNGANLAIDDLVEQGVQFTQAYAPRGETCPSLATLFSSRPPLEHGLLENERTLDPGLETLAERFQAAGFATAAFVTNPLLGPGSGFEQGFDSFACLAEQADRDYKAVVEAVTWVKQQAALRKDGAQAKPLFLWLHLMGPHLPYEPLKLGRVDYATLFTDPDYQGNAEGSREFLDTAYAQSTDLSGEDLNQIVALYDGEIARVNGLVHAFLQLYAGLAPNEQPIDFLADSALVFTADHGEELYQRNRYWAHSKSVYSSVLHVPLVLRHPHSLTGKRAYDEVVELQDLMPTLLDWFDLPEPAGTRGRSLLPLADSYVSRPFESRPAFASWRDKIFTLCDQRWRLVWNPEGIEPEGTPRGPYPVPELALFDLQRDPLELRDVAAEHAQVVGALSAQLQAWRSGLVLASRGDPGTTSVQRAAALGDLGYAETQGTEPPGPEQTGPEQTGPEQTGSEQPGSEQPGSEQPGSEQPGTEQPGARQPGTERR